MDDIIQSQTLLCFSSFLRLNFFCLVQLRHIMVLGASICILRLSNMIFRNFQSVSEDYIIQDCTEDNTVIDRGLYKNYTHINMEIVHFYSAQTRRDSCLGARCFRLSSGSLSLMKE